MGVNYTTIIIRNTHNPILTIKAPTLNHKPLNPKPLSTCALFWSLNAEAWPRSVLPRAPWPSWAHLPELTIVVRQEVILIIITITISIIIIMITSIIIISSSSSSHSYDHENSDNNNNNSCCKKRHINKYPNKKDMSMDT